MNGKRPSDSSRGTPSCLTNRLAAVCVVVALVTVLETMAAEAQPEANVPAGAAAAAEQPRAATETERAVPDQVRQRMQDRQYAEAVAAIDEALKTGQGPADYLGYLKGRALFLAKKHEQASATLEKLKEKFPNSPWLRRIRFAQAIALARKGEYRAAEFIYRAEAKSLLDPQRKQKLADIYLEVADALFNPPEDKDEEPDYGLALDFYERALEVTSQPDKRVKVELRIARCHQENGDRAQAAELYRDFIKQHADSPLVIEARFRLGEALLDDGDRGEARRAWQDLLAIHKGSKSERLAETAYKLSLTYGLPKPEDREDLELGVAALKAFIAKYPEHESAAEAHLRIAQSYRHQARLEDAVKSLTVFLGEDRYASSEEFPAAHQLLGQCYKQQEKFDEALVAWREYLAKHPTHRAWSNVQREIINVEYLKAERAHVQKDYDLARRLWGEFLVKYPLDQRNRQILFLYGDMRFQEEKWDEAIGEWRRVVSKYPDTNEASHAQFMIGVTMADKLDRLDEALKQFKEVTSGRYESWAKRRIAQLEAKQLTVATERVFRSDETPKLKLTTRNIDRVTVRLYTVDLETYFRKMHLARGVEGLDIALIDPDRTFEFEVPDYQDLKQTVCELPVPLVPDPDSDDEPGGEGSRRSGVMAVTVNSKTFEATTLVVQSDLDVIVKSSRNEAFVFAQNMRTGKPWPGARVLVSDGKQVFAEGTTGDKGVLHEAYDDLQYPKDVRVFAVVDGHVASNVVSLQGVGLAEGLSRRGYIYTDRPAYRAGQMVHVRGVIRQVTDDTYTVAKDKKYQLEVFDNRGRLVGDREVQLNAFGSFHTHVLLPVTAPQGDYRIVVSDEDDEKHLGSFVVHEYRLEPVQIEVDTERSVYYRGEEIEGTIIVSFYYGAPLVGRQVEYKLGDGRSYSDTTDEQGQVHFKLPTRDFRESQSLPLTVSLPERNLATTKTFFLATQGFTIAAETVRPVYLAGDTFELAVTTNDAEGTPISKDLSLQVLKQTEVSGSVGEVLVEEHAVQTDAKDGTARKTLRLEEGGDYVLRLEGTDRFGNTVSGAARVNISDEDDAVRLRILAESHTYKAGDTAEVQLHWREEPALALVTFQGARILDYRLLTLKKGANKFEIPMTPNLAPNFDLAVTVMIDPPRNEQPAAEDKDKEKPFRRFHLASSPFQVERDLRVSLTVKPKGDAQTAKPGDEVEVTVTTTDPQGKPIAAEVSLAMVEQALLSQFSSPLSPMDRFFHGAPRRSAVRTTSSIVFAYHPKTHTINVRLLAEAERLSLEEEEGKRLAAMRGGGERPFVTGVVPVFEGDGSGPPQLGGFDHHAAGGDDPFGGQSVGGGYFGGGAGGGTGSLLAEFEAEAGSGRFVTKVENQRRVQTGISQAEMAKTAEYFNSLMDAKRWEEAERVAKHVAKRHPDSELTKVMLWKARFAQRFETNLNLANGDGEGNGHMLFSVEQSAIPFTDDEPITYPDPQAWSLLMNKRRGIPMLDADGTYMNLRVARGDDFEWTDERVEALTADLRAKGAILFPYLSPHETAYWNPAIATGEKGTATVTFAVPERSTAWTLLAKGITVETLAGEASDELVVKKDLFGQLKLPAALTEGDKIEVVASVHNSLIAEGKIAVTLKTTIGSKTTTETKTLDVQSKGIERLVFPLDISLPPEATAKGGPGETAVFELTVTAGADGKSQDVVRRSVPVRPYGMPVYAIAGGSAESDATAFVKPPETMQLNSPSLTVIVGPTVERSLLDVLFAPAPWCQLEAGRITASGETPVSDLMAALSLQKLLAAGRDADSPHATSLDARVRSMITLLVSMQNDDGGWPGQTAKSSPNATARAVWALHLAKQAGYRISDDALLKGARLLNKQLAATKVTDFDGKAVLLHALAVTGDEDFPLANQLFRNRQMLSTSALLHLTLAFAEMDRNQTAGELLAVLAERDFNEAAPKRVSVRSSDPWARAPAELRALYALSLEMAAPGDGRLQKQVEWLMAHRTGHRWSPDKATGPAMLALCGWYARTRFEGDKYKLTVFVNDFKCRELTVDDQTLTQTIDVPPEMLAKAGEQRVRFEIAGRGRFQYQCILGGFVPADILLSTTHDWRVTRSYEPAPLEMDGQPVARGFDILAPGSYTKFQNELSQLPVAHRGHVELRVERENVSIGTPDERLEYLVVTEPLPAGTTVVEDSIQGGFSRYELVPGAITFYLGNARRITPIQFDVHGYLPGDYRVGPTLVRDAYAPDRIAVGQPRTLKVLPLGEKSEDEYRLTPEELSELGQRLFDKGEFEQAATHLAELLDKWNVRSEFYKPAARMLLDVRLETGPPSEIVRRFEIVIEKFPEYEIPFAKLMKIGDAYDRIGEYERSYLVFRATIEGSFLRESQVAGFLASRDEFSRSVQVMASLLREYPPEAYVASATYALAQRVYSKAPEAAQDEKLREEKVTRVDLIRRSLGMLDSFLTEYPDDPAADEASFSLASGLLDLDLYRDAIAACGAFARRFADSDFLDSYWYIVGYCHYALGEHEQAMEMCRKVAEVRRRNPDTGRAEDSPNKWRSVYILGQVYHSLGQAAKAIEEYRRVEDRFVDARQAIDYFARKDIQLPEVTTFRPGEKAEVELKYRNVPSCDVKVYRIDLMKFSLLKRNLGGITQINLSGIRPSYDATIELGDGKDYRDKETKLTLPVKDEGAYLVVCRGEDLHASGLVLVSPLVVEVQEDAKSGRVRATVRDPQADKYASDVHVKVIGTANEDFTSGETDLRGIFLADGILGKATVIAEAPGRRYAFHRGTIALGDVEKDRASRQSARTGSDPFGGENGDPFASDDLLEGLKGRNEEIQMEQQQKLDELYDNPNQGGFGGAGGFF